MDRGGGTRVLRTEVVEHEFSGLRWWNTRTQESHGHGLPFTLQSASSKIYVSLDEYGSSLVIIKQDQTLAHLTTPPPLLPKLLFHLDFHASTLQVLTEPVCNMNLLLSLLLLLLPHSCFHSCSCLLLLPPAHVDEATARAG